MRLKILRWSSLVVFAMALLVLAPQHGAVAVDCFSRDGKQVPCPPRKEALRWTKSALVEFANAPFPYSGMVPEKDKAFLDVVSGERKGHKTLSGRVLWEDATFRERRVLLHIPRGFDYGLPSVMIVFFHGHGATLLRDVRDRQLVPAQVAASGINAVLVAPQFAFNAADSSAGKFWEPGGFEKFIDEAARKLTVLHGNKLSEEAFAKMPIVIVAYSGGYQATAWCLEVGGVGDRIRGVVLLDALYGEMDKFATWISNNKTSFFVSSYTESTEKKNEAFKAMLTEQDIKIENALKPDKWKNGVTFLSAVDPEIKHEDFVTKAWAEYPIKEILRRLDEFRR